MQELKGIIQAIYPLDNESIQAILRITTIKELNGGELLIELGKRNQSEYFLLKGICRSYLLSPDGEEVTISFFNEGTVLSPYVTRTSDGISIINLQALTNVVIGEMDSLEFLELMVQNAETREFGNSVLRLELQKKVQKEVNIATLTAKERLEIFREDYPGFENLVPHLTISSYLGITNVSLSRLRKNKS